MTKKMDGSRVRASGRTFSALLAVMGLFLMSAGLSLVVEGAASAAPAKVHKSYVCKYVSKPGQAERLQTGQNPIWVANSSLLGGHDGVVAVGDTFKDGQVLSVVIVANTPRLNPDPTIADCPGVVTPDVLFKDSVCSNGVATAPSWVGTDPTQITYTVTSGTVANGSSVTITATPKPGFSFTPTANNVFTHTFGAMATNCNSTGGLSQVTPGVRFTESACVSNTVTAPSWVGFNTSEVTYTVTSGSVASGTTVTITATPKPGFKFGAGVTGVFTHTFGAAAICPSAGGHQATVAPEFSGPTCSAQVEVNLGGLGFLTAAEANAKGNFVDTGKVTYTIVGNFAPGGTVHVAASADHGFTLAPNATTSWTHTFGSAGTGCSGTPSHVVIPTVVHSGMGAVGMTPVSSDPQLRAWGYGLAGAGAAVLGTALVLARRRQTVSVRS